jgi:hypothetical protein
MFDNYFVNDNQVTGTKTVTNMGNNTLGQPYYNIDVNGSLILANSSGTISYKSHRVRTWTNGYNTPNTWHDDTYSITDQAGAEDTLTRANGNIVHNQITSPVIIDMSCRWKLVQGTILHTFANSTTATLDYGSGACDAVAAVTINGHTYNINIR